MLHRRPILAALLAVCLTPAALSAQEAPTPSGDGAPRTLTVTGTGTFAGKPDLATVGIGVSRDARTAGEALNLLSDGLRAVLARLEAEGIEARDLQTSALSLSPRYDQGSVSSAPRPVGFVAESRISVRIRDIGRVGAVIDAAVGDGANRLDGVSFGLAEPGAAETEARRRAVADARGKAETLTGAAGVTLGDVLAIGEGGGGFQPPMPMMRMEMAADSGMPVAPGEIETRVDVTITWEIGE